MSITPEELQALEERKKLGQQKKLFSIECMCKIGAEQRRHMIKNRTSAELMRFRQDIFSIGLMLPIYPPNGINADPISWNIINPMDILEIVVTRQSRYFAE